MEALTTQQVGRYTVTIYYDEDLMSPRDWDNIGRFSVAGGWIFDEEPYTGRVSRYRTARERAGGPILALPVEVLDGPYTIVRETDWHYADGFYYAPLSKVSEEGFEDLTGLRSALRAEISTLNDYLAGQAYGYVVKDPDGEILDSCWGFVGEDEYALSEGIAAAESLQADFDALPEWVRRSVAIREGREQEPAAPEAAPKAAPAPEDEAAALRAHLNRLAF